MEENISQYNDFKQKNELEKGNFDKNAGDVDNIFNEKINDDLLDYFFEDKPDLQRKDRKIDFLNETDFSGNNVGNNDIFTKENLSYKDDEELDDFFQREDSFNLLEKKEFNEKKNNTKYENDNTVALTEQLCIEKSGNKRKKDETETMFIKNSERNEKNEAKTKNGNTERSVNTNIEVNKNNKTFLYMDCASEEIKKYVNASDVERFKNCNEKENKEKKNYSITRTISKDSNEKKKTRKWTNVENGSNKIKESLKNEKSNLSYGSNKNSSNNSAGDSVGVDVGDSDDDNADVNKKNVERSEDEFNFRKRETEKYDVLNYNENDKKQEKEEEYTSISPTEVNKMKRGAISLELKKKAEEDPTKFSWYKHKRHFFIFTYSGKPVFTRYGNEENLTSFFGTLLAIISKMETFCFSPADKEEKTGNKKKMESAGSINKNTIKYIISKNTKIVFLDKDVLFLVCISKANESNNYILNKLEYIYLQVISLLTKSVEKALRMKPSYDIRNLLNGSDLMICNLISSCSKNIYSMLDGFEPLPLKQNYREKVNNFIVKFEINNVILSLIIINDKIVSLAASKNYCTTSKDLMILINMITSNRSFKTVESWTPICLPSHNSNVFMYAYINYIEEKICCVYVCSYSTSREFYCLSQHTQQLEIMLKSSGCYDEILKAAEKCPLELPKIEGFDIIHVCYYIPNLKQYYSSKLNNDKIKRIFRVYQKCNDILEETKTPSQIYMESAYEKYYCLRTNLYYLYLTVPFYATINDEHVNKILRIIATYHKELFINNIPLIIN